MQQSANRESASEHKGQGRRALVAGATGYIGRAVVRELLDRGWQVVALVRQLQADPVLQAYLSGAELRVWDAGSSKAADSQDIPEGHFDAVFSCIASRSGSKVDAWRVEHDANVELLRKLQHRCGHFVLLSAICVQRPRLAFQEAKLAFEAALQRSDVPWTIVRPTAFFKSLAGQVERLKRGKPYLLFADGSLTACKPISQSDLAVYLCDCVDDRSRHFQVLSVGGPGPALTPRQQGELLFSLLGLTPRFKSVPVALFDVIITVMSALGVLLPALRDKAEYARIGRYYATESMLLWDEQQQRYDADATPEFGGDTLEAFYRQVITDGMQGQELGEAALFDRSGR
ncbi:MAG: NAD(P)H-binding protein [Halieaceae bacterium]|jgi:divinyl chlorophyllide a 8-vinyl-reductase|nr:NAD(P)H-binding protein [Halieaceae bacterium]